MKSFTTLGGLWSKKKNLNAHVKNEYIKPEIPDCLRPPRTQLVQDTSLLLVPRFKARPDQIGDNRNLCSNRRGGVVHWFQEVNSLRESTLGRLLPIEPEGLSFPA